jgi:hypothetical protein
VVWTARQSASRLVVRAVRLATDGTVGQTVDIGRPFFGVDHVSVDADGDVTVLARSARSLWESWVRVLHPDGTLGPVQVLDSGFPLEAVPTADGLAVLTATFETERANPLTLTVLADGADPVEHLVTGHLTDEFRSSDLAVRPDGTLTVAWAAVGEPTQPQAVTGDLEGMSQLRLASTGGGRVFAAWIQGADLWSMALPSDTGTATGAADAPVRVGSGYYDVHAEATESSVMFFGLRDGNRTIAVQSWDGTSTPSRVHAVLSDSRFDNDRGNVHYTSTSWNGMVAVASARWMAAKNTQRAHGRVELALTR